MTASVAAGPPRTWAALRAGTFPAFVLLYGALYSAYGTESAYMPAFLKDHGLPIERVGAVLAAGTVVRIVAGPALGTLADRLGARKAVLAVAAFMSGLIGMSYTVGFGLWPLLGISMVHSAATAALAPLADALSLAASLGPGGFQYGWVRGVGSAAFVGGTLLSGQFVDRVGSVFIIWASSALFLLMGVCAWRVPSADKPAEPNGLGSIGAFRTLLADPVYRRLLLVAALVIGSHAVNDVYAVIRWREAGFGSGAVSLLWSESVIAEVAVFFLLGPWLLDRLGPARAAALSAGAGVLRWSVLGVTAAGPALVGVQALHGLTFALLHLAAMDLIRQQVPDELSGTAQTLYGTFALGIASAALTFAAGKLVAQFGAHAFWIMAALCVVALPFCLGLAARPGSGAGQP